MEQDNKTYYIIYCISQFARHFNITLKQAYAYLKRHKGLDFLYNMKHRRVIIINNDYNFLSSYSIHFLNKFFQSTTRHHILALVSPNFFLFIKQI